MYQPNCVPSMCGDETPSPGVGRTRASSRAVWARLLGLVLTAAIVLTVLVTTSPKAEAADGGRFTFRRPSGGYWGISFPGAGALDLPFAIDTDGDGRQEEGVYRNGRFTFRRPDGSIWGRTLPGAGPADLPLAIDHDGDGRQEPAVYRDGRFTVLRPNGSIWGMTFPGADVRDLPLAVDTNGDGRQEFGVYRNGRFTFLRSDGSIWGVTFPGANAADLPFAIDSDGNGRQELAVYRNGRVTVRRDNGSIWGIDFAGATNLEYPIALDSGGDGVQEFGVYDAVPRQILAVQVLADPGIDTVSYSRTVREDLEQAAHGQPSWVAPDGTAVHLSRALLRSLVHLGANHAFLVTALTSNGRGHSSSSWHYVGRGVDFDRFDGAGLSGRDGASLRLISEILPKLPSGSRIGQRGCLGATGLSLPAGVVEIADACNHLHLDFGS